MPRWGGATGVHNRTGDRASGDEQDVGRVNTAAIELRGVTRRFGEGATAVDALRGIDLTVPRGQFVVLLGPSGSGKTTLLNIIGGIDRSTSGSVAVADRQLDRLDVDDLAEFRRRCVGFVFQFFNLVPSLTAQENVALVAELVGREVDALAALAAVGLEERANHFPAELSGGEQQRVAIARALAKDPLVLLCDEPTGALDLDTGRQVLRLLRDTGREQQRTVVVVTHNQVIARAADRVLRLHRGVVSDDAPVEKPTPVEELDW